MTPDVATWIICNEKALAFRWDENTGDVKVYPMMIDLYGSKTIHPHPHDSFTLENNTYDTFHYEVRNYVRHL